MATQLDMEIKGVQAEHPSWSYDRCVFLAVEAAQTYKKHGQHPGIRTAMEKHAALDDRNTSLEQGKYAKLLDEAYKLMKADPRLTFGGAIHLAREAHPELRSAKESPANEVLD